MLLLISLGRRKDCLHQIIYSNTSRKVTNAVMNVKYHYTPFSCSSGQRYDTWIGIITVYELRTDFPPAFMYLCQRVGISKRGYIMPYSPNFDGGTSSCKRHECFAMPRIAEKCQLDPPA